jgi:hypothetical protein
MVKFPFEDVQACVLRHWEDKSVAPIIFYVGIGALHWLTRLDMESFGVGEEVSGVTDVMAKGGIAEELFFIIKFPRMIQVPHDAITVQLMDDLELTIVMDKLDKLRKSKPEFVPYDAEYEVCFNEKLRRRDVRSAVKPPRVQGARLTANRRPGARLRRHGPSQPPADGPGEPPAESLPCG